MNSNSNNLPILVFKYGALGDVVRTSYFAQGLVEKYDAQLYWVTSKSSEDILRFNPYVSKIFTEGSILPKHASVVLSLDDELMSVSAASGVRTKNLIGSFLDGTRICYTENSALWFDMGILSRYGLSKANDLKKKNVNGHAEIFQKILDLKIHRPNFYGNLVLEAEWKNRRHKIDIVLGLNPFAGTRWPSKEIKEFNFIEMVTLIRSYFFDSIKGSTFTFWLFCDQSNIKKALKLKEALPYIELVNTANNIHCFAAAISACDYVVSADSFGLHLSIAQEIPNLSYYAPTSGAEIDTFSSGLKILSTDQDYCSYLPDARNDSLTGRRLFEAWVGHFELMVNK